MLSLTPTCAVAGDRQHFDSQPVVLSLFDVLHEVPYLLDLLPSKSLAALLAVSQEHRRQIHNHVRRICLPGQDHIQTLVQGSWPSLIAWQADFNTWYIEDFSMCSMSDASLSLLAKGYMPRVHCIFFSEGLSFKGLSSAAIQGFAAIRWPRLKHLILRFSHINAGAETEDLTSLIRSTRFCLLCNHDPPGMAVNTWRLRSQHAAAIAHLGAASLPCLLELNLSCTGLTYEAFQQLCSNISGSSGGSCSGGRSHGNGRSNNHSECRCCWPVLESLNVPANHMCHGSPSMSTQHPRLTRQNMGRICHLKKLDLSHNNMTASELQHLTSMSWPCLEVLLLKHTHTDVNAVMQLVCGIWPRLIMLDIRGVAIGSPALQVLLEAPWGHSLRVQLTASLQDTAGLEQLVEIRLHKQHLRRMQFRAAQNPGTLLEVDATGLNAGADTLTTHWSAEMTMVGA